MRAVCRYHRRRVAWLGPGCGCARTPPAANTARTSGQTTRCKALTRVIVGGCDLKRHRIALCEIQVRVEKSLLDRSQMPPLAAPEVCKWGKAVQLKEQQHPDKVLRHGKKTTHMG